MSLPLAGSRRFRGEIEHACGCLPRLVSIVPSISFCCDRVFRQRNSICFWLLRVTRDIFTKQRRMRSYNFWLFERSSDERAKLCIWNEWKHHGVAEYSRENHSANQNAIQDFSAAGKYFLVSDVLLESSWPPPFWFRKKPKRRREEEGF